jgi:hypothetical protein
MVGEACHSNFQNTSSFMLRQGNRKYVVYPGYEPQLFNLTNDPDEVHNLANTSAVLVSQMDVALQEIVDYQAIADKVQEYNKTSFVQWRAETDPHEYEEAMSAFFQGWGPAHKAKIAAWLTG